MFLCLCFSSFTWSSSRLDRNLITVITGQAVETFDLQFRELYLLSRSVSLSKVPFVDEPIPDPIPQAAPAPVSAAVARKLINPKYALVATGTHTSPTSSDQNSSNKNSQTPTGLKIIKGRPRRVHEEPPIHPALVNMEKAYLIPYLPTWPEPDPPSDVIGFINIRDDKRAHQVHLQRSERFEHSQAIRFSSPLMQPAPTKEPATGQDAKTAGAERIPAEKTSTDASPPVNPTKKQQTQSASNKDQTDVTDSSEPPQQPHKPLTQETHKANAHTPTQPSKVTADSQPTDGSKQIPEAPQTAAPPVPKRRTLHLVIDPASSEQPDQPQVTLMKMDQLESLDEFSEKRTGEEMTTGHGRLTLKDDARDSGSNDDGSQDSTKVICDRGATDVPSSTSTASEEEFYDCSPQEPRDPLTNGVTAGSGRGHRQGDGFNMMARLSQSMLDLREPSQSQDSKELILQSQNLRRQGNPSPHRHIGQVSAQ